MRLWIVVGLALASATVCGCRQEPPSQNSGEKTAPAKTDGEARYALQGKVRSIDRDAGLVSIRHDEIPGYMPAMTMPFRLENGDMLEELQPGDTVRGVLIVRGDSSRLADVEITAWADPADLPGAKPKLARLEPGMPVPDFSLTTQDGNELKLSSERGNVVVLTFIYTRCPLPDYCPAMDKRFADLARRVKLLGDPKTVGVRLLSISFDPDHDTPEVLSKHARILGAAPPLWTFCVASHEELARVGPSLGLAYGPGANEIIHTLSTAVIDPKGNLAALELGDGWTVDQVFSLVRKLRSTPGG